MYCFWLVQLVNSYFTNKDKIKAGRGKKKNTKGKMVGKVEVNLMTIDIYLVYITCE